MYPRLPGDANPLADIRLQIHVWRRRDKRDHLPLSVDERELQRTGRRETTGRKNSHRIVRRRRTRRTLRMHPWPSRRLTAARSRQCDRRTRHCHVPAAVSPLDRRKAIDLRQRDLHRLAVCHAIGPRQQLLRRLFQRRDVPRCRRLGHHPRQSQFQFSQMRCQLAR